MSNSTKLKIVKTCQEMYQFTQTALQNGKRVGLVPTMGALHKGHLSLIEASKLDCDVTIVSIFVNPTQFGPNEDFQSYPRNLDQDCQLLEKLSVDYLFTPSPEAIYPANFSTTINPPAISNCLEGEKRPTHFSGVTTIVLKLFNIIPANFAYFGQKDYQQYRVITEMAQDLNLSIQIKACPIIREQDGLALSSRNQYLSKEERTQAVTISAALYAAQIKVDQGAKDVKELKWLIKQKLQTASLLTIDYIEICNPNTLAPLLHIDQTAIILVAAYFGKTRLIDNILINN